MNAPDPDVPVEVLRCRCGAFVEEDWFDLHVAEECGVQEGDLMTLRAPGSLPMRATAP